MTTSSPDAAPPAPYADAVVPDVRLAPVTRQIRDRVLALAPKRGQEDWSGLPVETLPAAESDPCRQPYAIVAPGGDPAGFFVLDTSASDASPPADLTLRAFFVDAAHQGRGLAGAALAALPSLIRSAHPRARSAALTVNCRNTLACGLYLRNGWADTGVLYHGGDAGPQHVLTFAVEE